MISRFTMIWIVLAVLAGGALFVIKHEVQEAESNLIALQRQIDAERETIHVLQAEWSYLTRPDRLERLSDRYLDLAPPNGAQILPAIDLSALPMMRPDELEIAEGASDASGSTEDAPQTAAAPTAPEAEPDAKSAPASNALAARLPPVPRAKPAPPRRSARIARNEPPPPPPAPPIPASGEDWLGPILTSLGRAR